MSEQAMNDVSILGMDLDTVEDVPGFDNPPSGTYKCSVSLNVKEINAKQFLSFDYTLLEVVSKGVQHPDNPTMEGQKFNTLSTLDTNGIKYAKEKLVFLKGLAGVEGNTIQDIVDGVKEIPVTATFKYRSYTDKASGEKKESFECAKLEVF